MVGQRKRKTCNEKGDLSTAVGRGSKKAKGAAGSPPVKTKKAPQAKKTKNPIPPRRRRPDPLAEVEDQRPGTMRYYPYEADTHPNLYSDIAKLAFRKLALRSSKIEYPVNAPALKKGFLSIYEHIMHLKWGRLLENPGPGNETIVKEFLANWKAGAKDP